MWTVIEKIQWIYSPNVALVELLITAHENQELDEEPQSELFIEVRRQQGWNPQAEC